MRAPPLVLASSSPRRRDVLGRLGLAFEVLPPPDGTEATWSGGEPPGPFALRLAEAKASAVATLQPAALVLAADTIVVLDGTVLGKPADAEDARAILTRLAGRDHTVYTALALAAPGPRRAAGVEATMVRFRDLEPNEIEAYVATGEPLDKAGAYGIQAYGASLVAGVSGCYFNVMGLPVARLLALLREIGWEYRAPGRLRPVGEPGRPFSAA
ncbi:MAG TPA: Maf family protein [Gemmatimonadota bacterium]|nr:Maf family protein [Gemmatimonadota bacterium]